MAVTKVIAKVEKYFPGAEMLAGQVEGHGLFVGVLTVKDDLGYVDEDCAMQIEPDMQVDGDEYIFTCGYGVNRDIGNDWQCKLYNEDNYIILGFDPFTGKLTKVEVSTFNDSPTMKQICEAIYND